MTFLRKYSKYKGVARTALLLIGLLFILILARESWGEFSTLIGQVKLGQFSLSVMLSVFGNVAIAILFNRLLGKYGVKIPDLLAVKMHMVGQIAKYIPGKIWAVAYQVSYVAGISGARGVVLANLEMTLSAMFMTSIIAFVLLLFSVNKVIALIVFLLGMIGFLLLYKTNVVNRSIKFLPRKFRSIEVLAEAEGAPTNFMDGVVFYLIFCFVYVFSYVLMLDAVFGFAFEESIIYIALLSAAWLAGVLAFIVPAGMGVREVFFVSVSSYVVPQHSIEILVSIAVLARFWQIIQELVGVSLLVFMRGK